MRIDSMRQGLVWSGNFDATTDPNAYNDADRSDDFTQMTGDPSDTTRPEVSIGCMGSVAALWIGGFKRCEIDHSVLGEIHVPNLPAASTIRIGDGLANFVPVATGACSASACNCVNTGPEDTGRYESSDSQLLVHISPWSPRDVADSSDSPIHADRGAIRIEEVQGLHGQIIINANNLTPPSEWQGNVYIGRDSAGAWGLTLSPNQSQPYQAPYYNATPAMLGGGAIGLFPYHIHQSGSFPDRDLSPGHGLLETKWKPPVIVPVEVMHYGPVRLDGSFAAECQAINPTNPTSTTCEWLGVTSGFTFTAPSAAKPRSILMKPKPNNFPHAGVYRAAADVGTVLCVNDGITGDYEAVWTVDTCNSDRIDYRFRLAPDCNCDGIDDQTQGTPTCTCQQCPAHADFNLSGTVTVQDIFDFLAAWFAVPSHTVFCGTGCGPADVNANGYVTTQDIFDFLAAWFGHCA